MVLKSTLSIAMTVTAVVHSRRNRPRTRRLSASKSSTVATMSATIATELAATMRSGCWKSARGSPSGLLTPGSSTCWPASADNP